MTGLRGSAHNSLATPVRLAVRPITLAIVFATSGGDHPAATTAVPATPSAPTAGDIQRSQPPRTNGPGAHP